MTENEIIEILQTEKACVTRAMKNECNRDCYNCDLCEEGKDILTVYDAVIKALEEREQYRAIGTVEEFKALKEKKCKYWNVEYEDCTLNYKEIENKVIDEFAEKIALEISESIIWGMLVDSDKDNSFRDTSDKIVDYVIDTVKKVAEQMKGGAE